MKDFLLVIPAYREQERFPPFWGELIHILSRASFSTVVLVVDDGSPRLEQERLSQLVGEKEIGACTIMRPLLLPKNCGKGYAILSGWRQGPETKWKAFVDADGAVPAYEVVRLFARMVCTKNPQSCVVGSRLPYGDRSVTRYWRRYIPSRIFAALTQLLCNIPVKDCQCGIKIIPSPAFGQINCFLNENRFCFDVELLALLNLIGVDINEVSIDWTEKSGGTMQVAFDGPKMFVQLIKLRKSLQAISGKIIQEWEPAPDCTSIMKSK